PRMVETGSPQSERTAGRSVERTTRKTGGKTMSSRRGGFGPRLTKKATRGTKKIAKGVAREGARIAGGVRQGVAKNFHPLPVARKVNHKNHGKEEGTVAVSDKANDFH